MRKVKYNDIQLEYTTFGTGDTYVIALHGHGKSVEDYKFFNHEKNTIVALDLIHHGNSYFPEKRISKNPLSQEEFLTLFNAILFQLNIDKFHLMAFSQGGRFALKIMETMPKNILSCSLFSPDGIQLNGFFEKASNKKWCRVVMHFFEKYPKTFYRLACISHKMGFINFKVLELTHDFTQDHEKMVRASRCWRNFRDIRSNPKKIGFVIEENQIPFQIIMGKFDNIFPAKIAHDFALEAELQNVVVEINSGHDFFKEESKLMLRPLLPFLQH